MYFGLDKTVIKNIGIKAIDLEHLRKLALEQDVKFIKGKVDVNNYVEYLQIIDSNFGVLTSGYKINGGRIVPYLFISINKPRIESNNLVPQSIEVYRKHYLKGLQGYIRKAYRLDLDFSEVKFENMEINCTFKLDGEYKDYKKVFEFMMTNAPKTYKLRDTRAEHGSDNTTFYIKNKSIQCKIYNKSLDLEHLGCEVNMNGDVCRIEYTLLDSTKIESVFGTSRVDEIQSEQLKSFFAKQFEKDFVKSVDKAIKEQQKLMIDTLKAKQSVNRQYVNKTVIEMLANNNLLDVEVVYNAIKKVDKSNYRRSINNFKRDCIDDIAVLVGNIERVQEVRSKVIEMTMN